MSRQRLDVKTAAEVLGISSEGVRKRIKRGALESEKDPDGRVYIWLDTDWTSANEIGTTQLTQLLQDQIEVLRHELEDWKKAVAVRDDELRRKDHIIAALTERIPEIEAPANSTHKETSRDGLQSEQQTHTDPPATQTGWWLRLLGQ
jgi:hypothetical protein